MSFSPFSISMSNISRQRILNVMGTFRPAFRSVAQSLTDIDLVLVEEAFERLLLVREPPPILYLYVFNSMSQLQNQRQKSNDCYVYWYADRIMIECLVRWEYPLVFGAEQERSTRATRSLQHWSMSLSSCFGMAVFVYTS